MPEPKTTARQDELLQMAFELTQEGGLAGLTIRRLADRAGFSEAALYRHFPSKRELLRALARRMAGSILESVRRIAGDESLPARERIESILRYHVSTILAVRGLPVLLLAEGSTTGDDELLAILRESIDVLLGLVADLVAEAEPAGEPADLPTSREVAHLLFGLATATAIRHRLGPDEALEEAARTRLPSFLVERLVATTAPGETR